MNNSKTEIDPSTIPPNLFDQIQPIDINMVRAMFENKAMDLGVTNLRSKEGKYLDKNTEQAFQCFYHGFDQGQQQMITDLGTPIASLVLREDYDEDGATTHRNSFIACPPEQIHYTSIDFVVTYQFLYAFPKQRLVTGNVQVLYNDSQLIDFLGREHKWKLEPLPDWSWGLTNTRTSEGLNYIGRTVRDVIQTAIERENK